MKNNNLYLIEINPRIQVEHTITENTTNIDLVKVQIEIAYKNNYKLKHFKQHINHSIQCRINLESKKTEKIKFIHIPGGQGIRFDSHIYNGYKIPIVFDKLIGKITSTGTTREEARKKMLSALNEIIIYNIKTNIPRLIKILKTNEFKKNKITTNLLNNIIK